MVLVSLEANIIGYWILGALFGIALTVVLRGEQLQWPQDYTFNDDDDDDDDDHSLTHSLTTEMGDISGSAVPS